MAKFHGLVGYGVTKDMGHSVYKIVIEDHPHYGDILENRVSWQQTSNLNDDQRVTNKISIVADAFAYKNFSNIRYVIWMGTKWKVTDISVSRPRIILTLGGVWNESENPT